MDTQNQGHYEEVQPASDLWNWEEQPELERELVQINERSKQDGTSYMAYVIERDGEHEDGNQVTIFGRKILDARLKKCDPGTRVKITSLGTQTSAAGFDYRNFRVDKWVKEGAPAPATQSPRDTRTPGRIAAERGEIARPMEPITNLPEDGGDINVDSIPF